MHRMSGGLIAADSNVPDYREGITFSVMMTCLMAASCGLIFGYDSGVSGGVTQMESFLSEFFPEVLSEMKKKKHDVYCKYDSQWLTAFTSSLYIAGMLSSLVASRMTRMVGRQGIMLIGGALFLAGSIINAAAVNIAMLIIGRMLLGFGLGFTSQDTLFLLGCSSVYIRVSPGKVAWHIHLSLQRLCCHRHTVCNSHQLLHRP
ncbi:unnamed protein product, partial [Urochloa humidicola]